MYNKYTTTSKLKKSPKYIIRKGSIIMAMFDLTFIHSQLFWLFVCFFALLAFMYKFAGPAVTKMLDERADQIRKDLEDAEKLKEEAEDLLKSYTKQMTKAEVSAKKLIKEAKATAKEVSEKELKTLEKALKAKSKQAEKQLESAKEKAIAEATSELHNIVITATEKLIHETVDSKKAKELTKEACKELN
ncbi:MAG: ATP synthase F0 subunit B [Proteobacteria bacterium]|nr:ATP synthase F0 subunit B [Pseudomonadota bacterium]